MLTKIKPTQTVDDGEGGISVSVQTYDDEKGFHRFTVNIKEEIYSALPSGAGRQNAVRGLIRAQIKKDHAAWLVRKSSEPSKLDLEQIVGGDITP